MFAAAVSDDVLLALAKIEDRRRRVREEARENLGAFIEFAARDAESNAPIQLDYIHRQWLWHLNYCWSHRKRAAILAPFGSGKSSGLAVPLAAWLIGRDPQIRMKFVSNIDESAKQRVGAVRMMIETPSFREVFPDLTRGDIWANYKLQVGRHGNAIDPTLHARGVLTTGIGARADALIFDDVCDQKNTEDQEQRRKVKQRVRATWLSRLDSSRSSYRALWIATPWHIDDATADIMQDSLWCTLIQRVNKTTLLAYDQEVINAGDDYQDGMMEYVQGTSA